MTDPIRVTISGPEDGGADAPTVEDFLGQVRDFLELLRGVEKAVEADGRSDLVWRVTDASMNSPISVELTPYGVGPAAVVAARINLVEQYALDGLRALQRGDSRPAYFTDEVMQKARRINSRILRGLTNTTIEPPGGAAAAIVIDRPAARAFERAMEVAAHVGGAPYRELGSVEGFVTKPELDGFGRAILRFRARLDGSEVKAFASGLAFRQIEDLTLSEVWHGVRVRVYGLISYRSLGQIDTINASSIEILDTEALPGIDDIVDPNFTGGLTSEEYLREQRADD